MNAKAWLDGVTFDDRGLVPVVMREQGGPVLTLAWATREALALTLDTGLAHFFSRSRNALWKKGETSGNFQKVLRVARDCDRDAVLYEVAPAGPACHTGEHSCFHDAPVALDEAPGSSFDFLHALFELVETRRRDMPAGSYTTKLFQAGVPKIAQKVGEEAVETVVAALAQDKDRLVDESADLLYHLLVLWSARGVAPGEVMARLEERHRQGPGRDA